jgi:two-component system response regulator HydG
MSENTNAALPTPPGPDVAASVRSVLVVDDEPAILLSFRRLLRLPGREIDTASTIEDAERLLLEKKYWAVIADLRLTGVLGREGLELIRFVREKNLGAHVILVTGYGSPEIRDEALELGAAFYFEKPVAAQVLQDALNSLEAKK